MLAEVRRNDVDGRCECGIRRLTPPYIRAGRKAKG